MNYRHAYHAGNFADVIKHSLFTRILAYLKQKDKPFRVIDTHAGIGLYDLRGEAANKTTEAEFGIERLSSPFSQDIEQLLQPYRNVLASIRTRYGETTYPGSPAITRELLRPQDRAIFVELHEEDHALLSERFNQVTNTKVLHMDGWTALQALIPPKEKRGIVLIDPPFEQPDELTRLIQCCTKASEKWPTGIYAAWYPVKNPQKIDNAWRTLKSSCSRPLLRAEVLIKRPSDVSQLNGCGLFIINPPWTLAQEAEQLLPALTERLAQTDYGAWRVEEQP